MVGFGTARVMAFSLGASWLLRVERRRLDFLYRMILIDGKKQSYIVIYSHMYQHQHCSSL